MTVRTLPAGGRSGSSISAISLRSAWSSSTRPGPKPTWRPCADGRRAAGGSPPRSRTDTGKRRPSWLRCATTGLTLPGFSMARSMARASKLTSREFALAVAYFAGAPSLAHAQLAPVVNQAKDQTDRSAIRKSAPAAIGRPPAPWKTTTRRKRFRAVCNRKWMIPRRVQLKTSNDARTSALVKGDGSRGSRCVRHLSVANA